MQALYHLSVFFLAVNLLGYILREKKCVARVSASLILLLFLLRLFLLK